MDVLAYAKIKLWKVTETKYLNPKKIFQETIQPLGLIIF